MNDDDPPPRRSLRVSIVDAEGCPVRAGGLGAWLQRIAPRRARGAVTIALVSDRRMRALNRRYRGIDRPTDVLSFLASPPTEAHPTRGPVRSPSRRQGMRADAAHLGDIVIARGVARRQAAEAGHAERTEWRVLALHGLLHLLGHDHERDRGAMRRIEARLRRAGGLPESLLERERA
jgi:probable rRNA maturation factor